jgi:hypothetical protein
MVASSGENDRWLNFGRFGDLGIEEVSRRRCADLQPFTTGIASRHRRRGDTCHEADQQRSETGHHPSKDEGETSLSREGWRLAPTVAKISSAESHPGGSHTGIWSFLR